VCSLTTSLRDSDQTLSAAQDHTTEELRTLLTSLYEAHGDDIEAVAEELKPCEYCATQHYEEFLLRELLNRALLDLNDPAHLTDRCWRRMSVTRYSNSFSMYHAGTSGRSV